MKKVKKITGATQISVNEIVEGLNKVEEFYRLYSEALKEVNDGASEKEIEDKYGGTLLEQWFEREDLGKFFKICEYLYKNTNAGELILRANSHIYMLEAETERLKQKRK